MPKQARANVVVKMEPEGNAVAWLEASCPACGTRISAEFPTDRVLHTSGPFGTSSAGGGQTELIGGPLSAQCSLETCRCLVRLVFLR